jgi:ribonuclease D
MFADTPMVMIEDAEALDSLVEKLRTCAVVGVDTEADSFHHYKEKLCLVQISDRTTDYIVDPLKVGDISALKTILEDPEIVVILHGGDYDVVSLKRDYGIQIRNIFDTMIAGQFLALKGIGLADLIGRYFGHKIDKKYQRHDWAQRPLEPEHLDYARGDTHWLLALREVMQLQLKRAGRLEAHTEECTFLERREWSGRGGDPADFLRVKQSNTLDTKGQRVLRELWNYRDGEARRMDRPSFKVLPDPILVRLAATSPTTPEAVAKVMREGSSMHRRHGESALKAVLAGLENNDPIPVPARKSNNRNRLPRSSSGAPGAERLFGPLKEWRNQIVRSRGLPPVVVASNTLLKSIARVAPTTLEDLSEVPDVRVWQVKEFGDELLDIIEGVSSAAPPKQASRPRRRRR